MKNNNRALISTSIMLVASNALAAMAAQADYVIDTNAIKANAQTEEATKQQLDVIMNKNVVKKDLYASHDVISRGYGLGKKSMHSKHYGDLVDKIKNASNAPSNVDSTSIGSTNMTPTMSGSQQLSDGLISTCHGVCHGNCTFAPILLAHAYA